MLIPKNLNFRFESISNVQSSSRLLQGLVSFCTTQMFAIVAVSYLHYLMAPPNRIKWMIYEFAIAMLLWWPVRNLYLPFVQSALRLVSAKEKIVIFSISIGYGVFISLWWAGTFQNGNWVHSASLQQFLNIILAVSQVGVATSLFLLLVSCVVKICYNDQKENATAEKTQLKFPATKTLIKYIFAICVFTFISNLFVVNYLKDEKIFYSWDYMVYWTKTTEMSRQIKENTVSEFWDSFRSNTQNEDYGPIPAFMPAVAMSFCGEGRSVYILAVANLYLLAIPGCASLFIRRTLPSASSISILFPFVCVLFSTIAWVPILKGYLDIGGVALAILVLQMYLGKPSGALHWNDVLSIGILLSLMTLFRRWYSFFVVAFFLMVMLDLGMNILANVNRNDLYSSIKMASRRIALFVMMGMCSLVFISSLAFQWVCRVVTTNYADDYYAYHSLDSLSQRVMIVVENCGIASALIMITSFAFLLFFCQTRRMALFVGLMPFVMLFHILKTQDPGPHHMYLFLPAFILLPSIALNQLFQAFGARLGSIFVSIISAWWIASMAVMYLPIAQPLGQYLRPAASRLYYPPMTRPDFDEFKRLIQYVSQITNENNLKYAVVGSSLTINPSMFLTADLSLNEQLLPKDRWISTPEVDRISCFPMGLLEADIVVVAWPPQTHLRPEEQQVVVLPAERIHNHIGIGKAFQKLPEVFHLANGVTVSLYQRIQELDKKDVEELASQLKAAHPTRPGLYTLPPMIDDYLVWPKANK